ncbi:GNAT family N-acetyltransferase [Phytoactinopolyspora endophytica]|uniref:GNAT family N-acetyltransferase n=1 Tax=Phytoactinopolyspora endophytica TaxID=1642495 RepID=UPI00101C7E94|nr:GNAT family N-acetyltransferase [Phytoactinopolyspora endophytica]
MRHVPPVNERDQLVGRRVVLRHRLHGAEQAATDVLGILMSWTDGTLTLRRSRQPEGEPVMVAEADVIAIKAIPARPVTRREVRDLEIAAAHGWQAPETHRIGDWLLRAAGGFTRRANSCIPLGDPGRPIDAAVAEVEAWYSEHGLPPTFQVPGPLGAGLGSVLDARRWSRSEDVWVLTAELDRVRSGSNPDLPPVRIDDRPDDAWLAAYHYRGAELPPHAVDVLTHADSVGFASVDQDGGRVAIARGAVTDAPNGRRWLGVTAVEVTPQARRRGLGSHVVAGLATWAAALGAGHVYLQVEEANTAAQAAYRKLGFADHHTYHYRQAPTS